MPRKSSQAPSSPRSRAGAATASSGAARRRVATHAPTTDAGGLHGSPPAPAQEDASGHRHAAAPASGTSPGRGVATPLAECLPYQRRWIDDEARFKLGLWARQTGKSWATALEAVRDCLERTTTWVCLSAGERQALEWMRKAREHAEAFRIALAGYTEEREHAEAILKAAEITWPNGSRIIAIPANPDTARGYSANLVLDEFAFHEQPDAIWRAIYPSITNPLRGAKKIRIVSTPNGLGNKFAELWLRADGWSKHRVTIEDAVREGLPVDIEELRAGLADPEGWAQEYLCEFLDAAAVLLPYDLIAMIESPELPLAQPPEWWGASPPGRGPLYIGVDFGRHHDLTVAWTLERLGDVLYTREVLTLSRTPTPQQVEILSPRIERAARVCLDYTGPGIGLGDYLADRWGRWDPDAHRFGRIELVTFSAPTKADLFSRLRMAAEERKIRIPADRTIREDLHSIYRVVLPGGGITYRAPHTPDGHADRATALALALRAAAADLGGAIIDPAVIRYGRNMRCRLRSLSYRF